MYLNIYLNNSFNNYLHLYLLLRYLHMIATETCSVRFVDRIGGAEDDVITDDLVV